MVSIGVLAFGGCSELQTVTIGSSVSTIDKTVFLRCSKLSDVYCYAESVPFVTTSSFNTNFPSTSLHVCSSSIEQYRSADFWKDFGNKIGFDDSPSEVNPSANANSEVHYSTYSNNLYDTELQVPAGNYIKVFNVKVISGSLELTERDNAKVACGEGVLVCTDAASVNVVKLSGYDLTPASEGKTMLKATPVEDMKITAPTGSKLFRLTYNNSSAKEGLGFYYGNADGTQVSSKIYKAYLQVPTEALGSSINAAKGFKLGDDTTGFDSIEFVPHEDAALPTYNLNGQQVDKSAKGILVKGNKKFYSK